MKKLFQNLWSFLKLNGDTFLKILFAGALAAQFLSFVPLISGFMDHRSIVEAHDNDAGKMVEVGGNSRWYNDNQFRYYGPLYFRLANTLHSVAPTFSGKYVTDSREAQEESVHFYLMLISLIGIYLLAGSCSYLLSSRWDLRFLSTLFLVPLFLKHDVWIQYVLIAHPDFLLTGLSALSVLLTVQMIQKNFSDKSIHWAGYAWGATLCTKLSVLFFMPGIGLIFYIFSKDFKETYTRAKSFTFRAVALYLILGFPQNFDIFGSLRKLIRLSEFSSGFTWSSFVDWWGYIGTQSFYGLIVIVVISLLLSERVPIKLSIKKSLAVFIALNIGLLLLTSRTIELSHTYYGLPFIAALLVSTVFVLQNFRFGYFVERFHSQIFVSLFLFVIFMMGASFDLFSFPKAAALQRQNLTCRNYHREIYDKTNAWLKEDQKMISTPYTPVPLYDEDKVQVHWEMNFEKLIESKVNLLIFNRSYYARYTDTESPTKYVLITNPEWKKTQDFYLAFYKKENANIENSGEWKKIYNAENCSIEIWQRTH